MQVRVMAAVVVEGERVRAWPEGLRASGRAFVTGDEVLGRVLPWVDGALAGVDREGVGVVLGTESGCVVADGEFEASRREGFASPAAFARTLPSTVAAEMSVKLGLKGAVMVVSEGAGSAGAAVVCGERWRRRVGGVFVVGGVEVGRMAVMVIGETGREVEVGGGEGIAALAGMGETGDPGR